MENVWENDLNFIILISKKLGIILEKYNWLNVRDLVML